MGCARAPLLAQMIFLSFLPTSAVIF
jgi:hypothetical protein